MGVKLRFHVQVRDFKTSGADGVSRKLKTVAIAQEMCSQSVFKKEEKL